MSIIQKRNPETPEILASDFPTCWVPIEQQELAAPGTFTINPPILNTYRNLALFCQLRSVAAAENDWAFMRFNNDGGANYAWTYKYGRGDNAFFANALGGQTGIRIGLIEAGNSFANLYTPFTIWIPGYKFADRVTMPYASNSGAFGDMSVPADFFITDCRGLWTSLNPVIRVDLWALTGTNFSAKSRVELYGIL